MSNAYIDDTEKDYTSNNLNNSYPAFVDINRDEEDKDVIRYQKTGDKDLFEKIYKQRIPTLQIWARQYYYLMDSREDAFCELSKYFAKAVVEYKKSKGSFNTCLFTFLINRIRNLNVGRNAKKRTPLFPDKNIKHNNFLYSLEYTYKDGKGDGTNTLKDVIPDTRIKKDESINSIALEETIKSLSRGCPTIKVVLRKISNGDTLPNIIKDYKTQKGYIRVKPYLIAKLNRRKSKSLVKKIIKSKSGLDKFLVIDYNISRKNVLHYTIELSKTKKTSLILSAIRKLRKNKSLFLDRVN